MLNVLSCDYSNTPTPTFLNQKRIFLVPQFNWIVYYLGRRSWLQTSLGYLIQNKLSRYSFFVITLAHPTLPSFSHDVEMIFFSRIFLKVKICLLRVTYLKLYALLSGEIW